VSAGRVIGEVWATRKVAGLDGRRMVAVAMRGEDRVVVAIDTLDSRRDQDVLVAFGSGARNVIEAGEGNRRLVCDAAVSMIIDGEEG
jgi:microcompartment protein CcmK/EutM